MSKWTIGSYNRFISSSCRKYGHSVTVARQHYREMRGRLGRPVFKADLRNHPRIASRTAARAWSLTAPIERPPAPPPEIEARPPAIPEELLEEFEDDEEAQFPEQYGEE